MSVYNTDFVFVKRAIDSVLNQTYSNFELIIIDDGSNNNTQLQLLDYATLHQKNITYLRHSNRGQSLSINYGVKLCDGDYITIIDADDEYMPQHLLNCINEMVNVDLIASTSQTIVDNDEDHFVPDKNNKQKLIHVDNCILFATLFGKRQVFEAIPFQTKYAADATFYELAAKNYLVKKVDLRSYIYYRNNPNSVVAQLKKQIILYK